jgi:hypothetical protein
MTLHVGRLQYQMSAKNNRHFRHKDLVKGGNCLTKRASLLMFEGTISIMEAFKYFGGGSGGGGSAGVVPFSSCHFL